MIGQNIIYYPTVTSTMEVAKEAVKKGAAEGTVILADEQTTGRGRLGRIWLSSPKSSIAMSLILYPTLEWLPQINMATPLAVVRSIKKTTGIKADIKWPNDVLIKGKKVCGTLIENAFQGETVNWTIVGIGLDVNLDFTAFPEIAEIATSLSFELGKEVPRTEILRCLLEEIDSLYSTVRRGESIRGEWQSHLETLGKVIKVKSGDIVQEGHAESVAEDGSLLLRRSDGTLAQLNFGEVTLRT